MVVFVNVNSLLKQLRCKQTEFECQYMYQGLKKIEFQFVLRTSSSQIVLALGNSQFTFLIGLADNLLEPFLSGKWECPAGQSACPRWPDDLFFQDLMCRCVILLVGRKPNSVSYGSLPMGYDIFSTYLFSILLLISISQPFCA